MLAYCYQGNGKPVLIEKPRPVLSESAGAIVKIVACSICGTDIRTYRFGNNKIKDGRTMGHEIVGRIEEISERWGAEFPPGTYISMAPAIGCGACHSCQTGHTNMCEDLQTIGFEYDGGFAEYMAIPAKAFEMHNVYVLPDSDDYRIYAVSEPLACVINAQSYLHIKENENVLIIGSGIIGCMHANLALEKGAANVMVADIAEKRVKEIQKLLPSIIGIDSSKEDLKEKVKQITAGKGVDVVIIACSVGKVQEQGMELLARRGRISLFGGLPGESKGFIDSNLIHYRELSVYGVHASTAEQNKRAMGYIRDGIVDAKQFISAYYSLENIESAFEEAEKGELMKIIVTM